jgi:hypothetical protein
MGVLHSSRLQTFISNDLRSVSNNWSEPSSILFNRVWCSGNIGDSHSPARGSTPRIRVLFCLFLTIILLLCQYHFAIFVRVTIMALRTYYGCRDSSFSKPESYV